MNIDRLRQAEAEFLAQYPDGFNDDGLAHIRKSHNVEALSVFAQENLTPITLEQPDKLAEVLLKIVSRSSMVSRFEKPAFREFINSLNGHDKEYLAQAVRNRLTGRKKKAGFEAMRDMLATHKIARWSVLSAVPFYFAPQREVFVKPTTAKKIVLLLEAEDLHYHPKPDWAFYSGYQSLIREVRKQVAPSLGTNNAAITGFLMSTL